MSKFDSKNKSLVNSTDTPRENDSLQRALSALPELLPTQDRLESVLRALAAKRELPAAHARRNYKRQLFFAAAASFVVSLTALFLWPWPQSETALVDTASNAPKTLLNTAASAEVAQLMQLSQQLEAGLYDLGSGSASFSQLYGRKQAELSLATLDTDLAEAMASNSGQAIDQQRALWRERVAVLSAVEQGDYRQALFLVD